MFKLLVVDDEPIIVEGLFELFSNYRSVSLDVYKAYSAQEALDWLNKKKIDVVISDIKMPEMDGLQLLKRIRLNWPECKVIFLTGYDEFSYIYEAVKNEGVSYLLKTESYENIIAVAERYFEEITNGYRNEELVRKAEEKMKSALPLLQKEFLSDLIDGAETGEISRQKLDELEIPLDARQPVILLFGRIVSPNDKDSTLSKSGLYSVNSTIEQYFSSHASIAGLIYQKEYIVWFLQPKTKEQGGVFNSCREAALYFRNILESIQCVCNESFHLNVSFAIGFDGVPWQEIFISSVALKSRLNSSMQQGMEVIVTDSRFKELAAETGDDHKDALLQMKKLDSLATSLELGKRADFFGVFSETRDFFTHLPSPGGVGDELYYAMSLLFISYINRHGVKEIVTSRLNNDRLWSFKSYATMEEAFAFFGQVAEAIFDVQTVETEKRSIASIQEVQVYIQNHLGEDLSLNSLAEIVFFNPKYLSRLFKQVTGVNLSDYINEKRLAKAKELLKQSHIKIYEIAQAVGYSSNSYFTMFFKKGISMTPQEFRESLIK